LNHRGSLSQAGQEAQSGKPQPKDRIMRAETLNFEPKRGRKAESIRYVAWRRDHMRGINCVFAASPKILLVTERSHTDVSRREGDIQLLLMAYTEQLTACAVIAWNPGRGRAYRQGICFHIWRATGAPYEPENPIDRC
jgi:hypothetical protein